MRIEGSLLIFVNDLASLADSGEVLQELAGEYGYAQLFKLYTGFIRPCLEYCSHNWGTSTFTSLPDRVESKLSV